MKKLLLLTALVAFVFAGYAQDPVLIQQFSFPVNNGNEDDFNADAGLEQNTGYDIRMGDLDDGEYVMEIKNGMDGDNDYSAGSSNWDNGANFKHMSIKYKAANYRDFQVSFSMESGSSKPGPKYWKLMCNQSGADMEDVPNGTFEIADSWVTIADIMLPESMNYPGGSSYIYWMPTSNESTNGGDVAANGNIKIDNIVIMAVSPTGIKETLFDSRANVYPNPSNGTFTFESTLENTPFAVFNMTGAVVYEGRTAASTTFSLDQSGVYFIRLVDEGAVITKKITVK